jgi:hypothetical protein
MLLSVLGVLKICTILGSRICRVREVSYDSRSFDTFGSDKYSFTFNVIFQILTLVTVVYCSQPTKENEEDIKKILSKFIDKIPDLEPKYIKSESISNMISKYYQGKINTFPLYKISLKIDRNPVKIPWSIGVPEGIKNQTINGKKYQYARVKKQKQ